MPKIKFQDKNLNKGTDEGRHLVDKSVKKFGMRDVVILDKKGEIVSGNHRKKAADGNGITKERIIKANNDEVIAIQYDDIDLDTKEGKELALALNQTAKLNINIDEEMAFDELGEVVEEWGIELEDDEIEAEEDDFDTTPPEIPITVLGDLYEIGEHRLLCGDSTDSDQVARLMNGEKADMVFTDPPYGVSYQSNSRTESKKFEVLKNDNVFITEWIGNLPLFTKGFVFVWTSWKVLTEWIEFCKPIGELSNMIIWDKGGGGLGDLTKTFYTDFEIALVYNRGEEIKGKRIGSVWSVGKDSSSKYQHPTQKPVELPATAIENVSTKGNLVLDLFLGSGSTMVAAHQLKRKCYGMELDPKYCDVIVKRMIKQDPNIKVKRNGNDCKSEFE